VADDPRLVEILQRFGEAEIDGESVSLEELCDGVPELIGAARRRIDQLRAMDALLEGPPACAEASTIESVRLETTSRPEPDWKALGYEIVKVLGTGGMGIVYLARHVRLERLVALKTIPSWVKITPNALARFDIEARAVARLHHPNIVQIYDIGSLGGRPYLSLEYAEAGNLSRAIRERLPEPREAARIALVLARAVAHAHKRGILHRDLKPSNILVCGQSSGKVGVLSPVDLKIADFGLALLLDSTRRLTLPGTRVGTPGYMAPEQAQGRIDLIGPATDVYGLGIVLYEMICGRPPFKADSEWAIIHQIVTVPAPPIRKFRPECPPGLEAICLKCLRKTPDERFASAAALAEDLGRFLAGERTSGESKRRLTRRAVVAGGALAAAGGAGGTLWMMRRSQPVRVGILQSQTGTMGEGGRAVIEANLVAIDELNKSGGVLGRPIEPIVSDGESDEDVFAREARRMIVDLGASVIFGGLISSHCHAIEPVVRELGRLLFYPAESEGLAHTPNVVRLGLFPNQHVLPAIDWAKNTLGKRRFFMVGSDSIYPRVVGAIVADAVEKIGVKVVGEAYFPWNSMSAPVVDAVKRIEADKPDLVLSLLYGKANSAFIQQLRGVARIASASLPCISFCLSEQEMRNVLREMVGDYVCGHYFQGLESAANAQFLERIRGSARIELNPFLVSDAMEASYVAVHLWAKAVVLAGTADDLDAVRRAVGKVEFDGPGGPVRVDPSGLYTRRFCRVGRVKADRNIEQVWASPAAIAPIAYPGTRSGAEWEALLEEYLARWKGHWSNPGLDGRGPV
jgi:urea transport system substrate-binding protein